MRNAIEAGYNMGFARTKEIGQINAGCNCIGIALGTLGQFVEIIADV